MHKLVQVTWTSSYGNNVHAAFYYGGLYSSKKQTKQNSIKMSDIGGNAPLLWPTSFLLVCFFLSAAHVGSGHDWVQEEPASLPPGQASHQLHGCQTVSVAGRSTRSSRGAQGRATLLCPPPQEDSHLTEPALVCACVCVCLHVWQAVATIRDALRQMSVFESQS